MCAHKWIDYCIVHVDVIKWKHFSRYWPFVRGIHRSPVNYPDKGQWPEALIFLSSAPEQTVKQTIETPVIWDAIVPIMTSLPRSGIFIFVDGRTTTRWKFYIFQPNVNFHRTQIKFETKKLRKTIDRLCLFYLITSRLRPRNPFIIIFSLT